MRVGLVATAICLSIVGLSAAGESAAAIRKPTRIPAQRLDRALQELAHERGLAMAYRSEIVGDRRTAGASGELTADEALTQLLGGTGLVYRYLDDKTVTIVPATQSDAAPNDDARRVPVAAPTALRETLEEITVTGSNLRASYSANPALTTIDRANIEKGGFIDATQALRAIPGNFGGGLTPDTYVTNVPSDGAQSNGTGVSSPNLLGLGSGATLTLLNGRRLPVAGEGIAVDLSMIPISAIDRIDVLADGASAIYGTDAVAGVVNIITRRSYEGVESRLRYGGADGGLGTYTGSILAGHEWGNFNGVVGVEYLNQNELDASKRAQSRPMLSPTSLAGDAERTSAFASARYNLTDTTQLHLDALYMHRAEDTLQTVPVQGVPVQLVTQDRVLDQHIISAGLSTRMGERWTLDVSGTLNGNTAKTPGSYTIFATNTVFPFGATRTNKLSSVEATASGPSIALPAGEVDAAFGVAWRDEEFRSASLSGSHSSRKRSVSSAYAELGAPLVSSEMSVPGIRELRITAAGRLDDYSDVGSVIAPKVGFVWSPAAQLAFNASFSKSFRAPSAFDRGSSYYGATIDALDNSPAGVTRIIYLGGTGAELRPERSENLGAGVIYTPAALEGLRLQLSYYRIDYTDRIANPDPTTALGADIRKAPAQLVHRNPTLEELNVVAAGASLVYPVGPGVDTDLSKVTAIVDARNTNIAVTHIDGVQGAVSYNVPVARGSLALSLDATYIRRFADQLRADAPETDRVATIFSPPHFRSRAALDWTSGRFASSLFWNFVGAYDDNRDASRILPVDSWSTFDGSVSVTLEQAGRADDAGTRLTLSVQNLLDENPPVIAQSYFSPAMYDSTNASVIGRFASVEIMTRW